MQFVRHWACDLKAHIVCIQETRVGKQLQPRAEQLLRQAAAQYHVPAYKAFWAPKAAGKGNGATGVAILVRSDLISSEQVVLQLTGGKVPKRQVGADGRSLQLRLQWRGHKVSLVNTYLPAAKASARLQYINTTLNPIIAGLPRDTRPIVCGDFNFTEDPKLDRLPQRASHSSRDTTATAAWKQAAAARTLQDAFRYKHPERREFSFFQSGGAARSRIDRFYVGESLLGFVEQCCPMGTSAPSDHRPVLLHLRPGAPSTQGRGLPKLRLCALSSEEGKEALRTEITQLLRELQLESMDNKQLIEAWPAIKARLSAAAAKLAKRHARRKAAPPATQKAAEQELQAAEQQLARGQQDQEEAAAALQRAVRAHRAMAAATRDTAMPAFKAAKYQWLAQGEHPSPLISALMDPPLGAGKIPCLRADHGDGLITSGPQLAEHTVSFYAKVSKKPVVSAAAQDQVLQAVRAKAVPIPGDLATKAGSNQVTVDEVKAAMKGTKPSSSPGPDGIPPSLWRWCKEQLAPVLAQLYTAMGTEGLAPADFPQGAVAAIYKGKGDTAHLSNYRPITLLNTDYRLLAKVMASRWGEVLGKAVGREQTAFLPGRLIGENVMLLQLLPAALAAQRIPGTARGRGAAAFLDFLKAYDTVDRGFLFSVMEAVGAGGGMLSWAKLLLSDTRAVAVINGHVSTARTWEAGVRQGCPLAPAMYLFVAWALSCWLQAEQHKTHIGIDLGGEVVSCTQYADDTTPLLNGYSEAHVQALIDAMDTFAAASGQHLNKQKCQLLLYGWDRLEDPPDSIGGIKVVSKAKTLGVFFSEQHSNGEAREASVDWEELLKAVSNSYDKLARLPMSMFGRASAGAGYGISKMLYHAEFAVMPEAVLQQLSRITAKLVDRGLAPAASVQRQRLPGIRTELLTGPPSAGGVGMLPWQLHLKARHAVWAGRLLEWLARLPFTRTLSTSSCLPPWALAAAVILRGHKPHTHPALTFMSACIDPGADMIRSQPLQRLAAGMAALGPPIRTSLQDFPVGPWCKHMPIWGNPLLRLEAPLSDRPLDYQQMVRAQTAAHKARLPPPGSAIGRYAHMDWDWEVEARHEGGWWWLQCLPQTATIQQLEWLNQRLENAKAMNRPLRNAVHSSSDQQPNWDAEQRLRLDDMSKLLLMVKSLLVCVPRTWRDVPYKREDKMTTHALTLLMRSIGWDAASITALPKQLSTPGGRAAATAAQHDSPEGWVPAAFQHQPRLQLFSSPLPLTVKLATRLQQGPWRSAVRDMHMRCIRAALQLDQAAAENGQHQQHQQHQRLLQRVQPRLKTVWQLSWGNHFKETWWRLLLEGVPAAGGHGIALNGPCPCGWMAPAHLDKPARAAAQRDHVFWHCPPALAVRRVLAHNLPPGTQLQAQHLWLLQPPCAGLHAQVWMVVGLAALTVLASARKHMWALHLGKQEQNGERQAGARRARRNRQQDQDQDAAEPHIAATRRAVVRLVDGVMDFVELGEVPDIWKGQVQQDHAFIGVRTRQHPTNAGSRLYDLVYNMNIPDDLIA
jgi:exonuclease III